MGIKEETGHTAFRNLWNFALMIAVGLPAVLFTREMYTNCPLNDQSFVDPWDAKGWSRGIHALLHHQNPVEAYRAWKPQLCALTYREPVAAVNLLFFVNVVVGFWIIGRMIHSDWIIDPYWTLLPPMIAFFYATHPYGRPDVLKSAVSMGLLLIWSVRLTHSYFRREEWNFGAREDWRFTEMRATYGRHWWWLSFFLTYLSQQFMLVGLTLPYYGVFLGHRSMSEDPPAFGALDLLATLGAAAGLLIAYVADTDLRGFTVTNEKRKKKGQKPLLVLDTGLFRYSRHPNHFGEQLFWWSIALFGVSTGHAWTVIGTAFNTLIMIKVGYMVEDRMYSRSERAAAYRAYAQRTSFMVPWFPGKEKKK